jgi:peptide-methionine (S)-S-oxide reductase
MAMQQAILAGGCFWCTEAVFAGLKGVEKVESGYIGGQTAKPTYKEVCSGTTGHAEAIRVTFDDEAIGYGDLLDVHFATHDPTQLNRQGNDVGTQYRSALFPLDDEQRAEAEAGIEPNAPFHVAEDYHQDYWEGEGQRNPYCLAVIPPKLAKLRKGFADKIEG